MAIDTEARRRSAGCHLVLQVMPVADGSNDQGDRQQTVWLYRGILATSTGAAAVLQPGFYIGPKG